ncbi:MAG: hypothetical protein JWP97_3639 [Labilithrix sp.]|nr:hypothetical protein [Labilithrix sp.]
MSRLASSSALTALAGLALVVGAAACTKTDGAAQSGAASAPDADDAAPPFTGDASVIPRSADEVDAGVLNVTPLPAASIAQMVNPEGLPAYRGPTGSIEGTITVTGEPPADVPGPFGTCNGAARIYGKTFREGPMPGAPSKDRPRPLADAVVVVTGYAGYFVPEKREAATARIEGCGYTARTVTMTFGQRLEVKNVSREFWTPELEPAMGGVLMMAPPSGDPTKIYPKKPGHYLLVDHDRKYVKVDLYTFLHPLHAVTDAWGHYRIDGLPVGAKLKVSTMHPHIEGAAAGADITVEADVVKTVDLALKNASKGGGAPAPSAAPTPRLH